MNRRTRENFVFLIVLALGGLIYFYALTPYIGDGYDDTVYVGLSKGLAEGRGYVRALVPGMPPASKYPPGWAFLLSIVWLFSKEFPANLLGFKLVSVIFTLGLAAVVFYWLRWRGESFARSFLIALLTLFHPYILSFGTSAFSAIPFAALTILSLWLVERYTRLEDPGWRDAIFTSLVVAFSLYLRMFGLSIIIAIMLYLIFRKAKRAVDWRCVALILLWVLPWLLYFFSVPQALGDYRQEFFLRAIEQPELGTITTLDLLARIFGNLHSVLLAGLPGMILPSQISLTYVNMAETLRIGAPVPLVDYGLPTLIATATLVPILMRRSLLDWYIFLYLGLVLLWPWEPTRFLVPLTPLLYLYLFSFLGEIRTAISKFNMRMGTYLRVIAIGIISIFILLNIGHQINYAAQIQASDIPANWAARYRLFDWLKENTPDDAVLASLNDYQLYLYTERQTVRTFKTLDAIQEYGVDRAIASKYQRLISCRGSHYSKRLAVAWHEDHLLQFSLV